MGVLDGLSTLCPNTHVGFFSNIVLITSDCNKRKQLELAEGTFFIHTFRCFWLFIFSACACVCVCVWGGGYALLHKCVWKPDVDGRSLRQGLWIVPRAHRVG